MGLFLSLSNLPYWYSALIEGRALERWGIQGLLILDGLLGLVGCMFVVGLAYRVGLRVWRRTAMFSEATAIAAQAQDCHPWRSARCNVDPQSNQWSTP
jgi:hypothetical protein